MVTMRRAVLAVLVALALGVVAQADTEAKHPEKQNWSWSGPLGKFDRQELQRGYQVYKDVCAACHGMRFVAFRNLGEPGGPEFTPAQVKALAAAVQVNALDDKGEPITRPGTPADRFPSPYPNEIAARAANNNALPPDLSVIAKAREGGPDYLYALLMGYSDPPAGFQLLPGLSYNAYFPGHQIAMPGPLTSDGQVTWPQGNPPASRENMAKSVVALLMWAAEPKMEERKELGVMVMVFLAGLSVLLFLAYRRLWRDVDH